LEQQELAPYLLLDANRDFAACRASRVMRAEFFISILTGAVAPNAADFAPVPKNVQCMAGGLEVEGG